MAARKLALLQPRHLTASTDWALLLLVQAYRAAASEGTLHKSSTLHRSTSSASLNEGRGRSVSPAKSDCTR